MFKSRIFFSTTVHISDVLHVRQEGYAVRESEFLFLWWHKFGHLGKSPRSHETTSTGLLAWSNVCRRRHSGENYLPCLRSTLQAIYHLGHHVCHKLWYTNNAVNFYLYCLTGKKFRRDLLHLFGIRRQEDAKTNVTVTMSMSVTDSSSPQTK